MKLSRLLAAPVIAGVMVLAQAAAISPAYADVHDVACNYDHVTFNACLNFQNVDAGTMNAHVGLDAFMPERYAQEIVSYGAGVRASLWGVADGHELFIADLTIMPGWPAAGPDGLGAELSADVTVDNLNVNIHGDDEAFAIVSYFDYHTGSTKEFRTGTVHADFALVGGGGGCLLACQ